MYWSDSTKKLLVILKAISEELDANVKRVREDKIVRVLDVFSHLEPMSVVPEFDMPSALLPIEDPKEYTLSIDKSIFDLGSGKLVDLLADREVSVLSFDSSSFSSGPHIYVDILLINIGYWYMDYASAVGGSGNKARIFGKIPEGVKIRIKIKEVEYEVLKEIIGNVKSKNRFLFLDESLNLLYTLSWANNERRKMVDLVSRIIEFSENSGVVPLGVFYTSASDISKTLISMGKLFPEYEVRDRLIMDRFLSPLSRSPIFRVYSKALEDSDLEINAIYIKSTPGNILRIEFPSNYSDMIDEIHLVVLAQAILGGGYPYALQKAHEMAVITYPERELILEEICRKLGIPSPQLIYSKKQYYKWWPIE